jgi:alpha-beta hydrolase superfamily lysophospholipase
VSELVRGEWKRTSTGGPALAYSLRAAATPRAALAVIPGYADYSGRYAATMDVWAERGLTSVAVDLRGHGRSGGARGHVLDFDEYLDDVRELLALMDAKAPAIPRFVFGHSFGALVAVKAVLAGLGGFRAMALSDPYFGLAMDVPPIKILAGKIASRLVPSFGLPSGLSGAQMTTDAATAARYDRDELVFKNVRARWFTETRAAQGEVLARAREVTLPLMMTFGSVDPVAKLETGRQFFDACGSTDKEWETLEGLRHEPLNEPNEGPALAARIGTWLVARALSRSSRPRRARYWQKPNWAPTALIATHVFPPEH